MNLLVRLLGPGDAAGFFALRRHALLDSPHSFSASPSDDIVESVAMARDLLSRRPDSVTFGAFAEDLVGILGVLRSTGSKSRHKASIVGMYVATAFRRRGIGHRLLIAGIDYAGSLDGVRSINLCVTDAAPSAKALYERAGFRLWGVEREALCVDGDFLTEYHMSLALR